MRKFTKLMLTLALLVMGTVGVNADWEQVYKVDYSDYTSFPWYVMGFTPEFIDGVMTDQGADGWHQYFIADGIPTQVNGNYTVKAMIKGSEAVNVNVNMGWGWGEGESKGVEIVLPTEWTEVEWSYEGVGGTSCNLVAQPWKGGVTIEWKWLKVGYEGTTVWKDIIVNGNLEGESAECFYITEQGVGGPYLAPLTEGVGKDGSKAVKVESYNNPSQDWDTQFFIRLPYQLPAGTSYKVSFDYKATKEGRFQTQSHAEPGDYIHWAGIGEGTFTTQWKTFEGSGTISADQSRTDKPMQTIAFNLSLNKVATKFFIDNVKFEVSEEVYNTLSPNPAENPRQYPAAITSMAIVGFDGVWQADNGWEMTQDTEDEAVWTLDKPYTAEAAGKHEFKAAANGNWDRYVLPSGENDSYTFGAGGDYILHFTVNTKTHSLTLDVERVPNKMVILGDFLTGSENDIFSPANGWVMTQSADNSKVWTYTTDYEVAAKTYRFKAVGNDNYDYYQLPGSDNETFEFGTADYPIGNYELTFTVNTEENTIELTPVKKPDTYTVAGDAALFGTGWDANETANNMTEDTDGTYSILYENKELEAGTIKFKVVMNHSWNVAYPSSDYELIIPKNSTYDVTITFNPETKEVTATAEDKNLAYYLVGGTDSWTVSENPLTEQNGVYSVTIPYVSDYSFAIVPYTALNDENTAVTDWAAVVRPESQTSIDFENINGNGSTENNNQNWKMRTIGNGESLAFDIVFSYNKKNTWSITASTTTTIGEAGYATYSNAKPYMVEGATANFVTLEGKVATLVPQAADAILPAMTGAGKNSGIILSGDAGNVIIKAVDKDAEAVNATENLLAGSGNYSYGITGDFGNDPYTAYIFAAPNGKVGFYLLDGSDASLAAHKAFLAAPVNADSVRDFIGFEDTTTGVDSVHSSQLTVHSYYNLNGQRVAQPTKGLYIMNGKKVVIK